MLRMINLEMDQIEEIQREFNGGAINIEDIANRLTTMNICLGEFMTTVKTVV